jgi:hypothetical protein
MIPILVAGRRSNRQPLAYPALAPLFEGRIRFVTAFADARILLFAHPDDLIEAMPVLARLRRERPDLQVALLSEEPLWDTVGPVPPFSRIYHHPVEDQVVPVSCLNHHTTRIYDFARIPYFVLTEHAYPVRYALRFRRNAAHGRDAWKARFAAAPIRAAFLAMHRLQAGFEVDFPEHGTRGLSVWRTRLAQACAGPGVIAAGSGWETGAQNRPLLRDWHLDKLLRLDGRCRLVSAVENTHWRDYVSEKIFDAFAVGAVPIYYAGPDHAVHRLVPEGAWLNLYGMEPEAAAEAVAAFRADADFLDRYRAAQAALRDLFDMPAALVAERARLARALVAELEAVAEQGG